MNFSKKTKTEAAVSVTNKAGGKGYRASSALDALIMKVGKPGFSEPTYYGDPQESIMKKMGDLEVNVENLTEEAVSILEDIVLAVKDAVHSKKQDELADVLRLACYLRNENKIRMTPQVILAMCSKIPALQHLCRLYAPKIVVRADEIKEAFAAARFLFNPVSKDDKYGRASHHGTISKSLKKALGDSFSRFPERDFLKWAGKGDISFKDVLLMCYQAFDGKSRPANWPVSPAMWRWLVYDEVSEAVPQALAWEQLNKLATWGEEARELVRKSGATWEVIASKFGGSTDPKQAAEVWEWLATATTTDGNKTRRVMPYQATLMNLRNFAEKGVSNKAKNEVAKFLVEAAPHSRMLPMQFMSARKAVEDPLFQKAIAMAIDATADSLPGLLGSTVVAVDTSGSMETPLVQRQNTYRGKTQNPMTVKEAACLLGAICYRKAEGWAIIGALASGWSQIKVSQTSSVLDVANIVHERNVGAGTNLGDLFATLKQQKTMPDRIILLTDGQSWMGERSCYYGSTSGSCNDNIKAYRSAGWTGHLHEIHMVPYETTASEPDKKCHVFSSYSENLVNMVRAAEGLEAESEKVDTFNVEAFKAEMRKLYP